MTKSEQNHSKELIIVNKGVNRVFMPDLVENAIFFNQLPILAPNMMQVARQ